jgi:hypothetical protein
MAGLQPGTAVGVGMTMRATGTLHHLSQLHEPSLRSEPASGHGGGPRFDPDANPRPNPAVPIPAVAFSIAAAEACLRSGSACLFAGEAKHQAIRE